MLWQERLLGEDGHPRKAVDGEDPFRMGLVLEWVYGTIVSTAEKARDGAKRPLGESFFFAWEHLHKVWHRYVRRRVRSSPPPPKKRKRM